jgi:ubiquinol-cytochrome c reductase cytochrome b subunit
MHRPVQSYARWPHILGILSFLLFVFLVATGVLLVFYYHPTATEAYRSVTTIVRDVNFGWFVHQSHLWGARLFLVILLVRLWRFYFHGIYKAPREALWMISVVTFLVSCHADLTGRLLSWNASGYWTTVRALEILYALPVLGPGFEFLVGGPRIDSLVLTRFFILHVVGLPTILLILFYLHFSGVRLIGLSSDTSARPSEGRTLKVHLFNTLVLAVLVFGCLVTLATLLPAPYMPPADPLVTLPDARPPWYFIASYAVLEIFPRSWPRWVPGLGVVLTLAATLLLPLLDRSPARTARERRPAIVVGAAVIALWVFFTWLGYRIEVGR